MQLKKEIYECGMVPAKKGESQGFATKDAGIILVEVKIDDYTSQEGLAFSVSTHQLS